MIPARSRKSREASRKTERIQLVITAMDRRAWVRAASRAKLSLNEFVRQQVNAGLLPTTVAHARAVTLALTAARRGIDNAARLLPQGRPKLRKACSPISRKVKPRRS